MIQDEPQHLALLSSHERILLRINTNSLLPEKISTVVAALATLGAPIHAVLDMGSLVGVDATAKLTEMQHYVAALYRTRKIATRTGHRNAGARISCRSRRPVGRRRVHRVSMNRSR
jgi:hypothetical protein